MLAHFLGMLAEYEWEKIRERTMTGRTNAVKRGEMKALSAHKMRYGYQWEDPDKKDKIILNRKEAVVIRWMSIRYVTGTSASTLVRILKERGIPSPMGKEWSNHTIMTLFSDPRITGKGFKAFHYKEDRYKSHHESVDVPDGTWPAIISMETFRRIQMRAERNKAEASRSSKCPEEFLLRAGYVRCAICKIAMRSCHDDRRPGARYFYRCNEHGMIPSKELDASTWQKVEEMADHLSLIEQAIELASNSDRLMANINAVQASIDKWQAAANSYLADLKVATLNGRTRAVILQQMDEANEMVMRLESEKAQLEDGLVDKESRDIAYQEILDWCKKIKEARGDLSYTRKRDFLDMLGVEVLVYCEKPYRHNSRYEMRVALPDLQKLIPIPSEENEGELVTPTLARRSRRPLCRQ